MFISGGLSTVYGLTLAAQSAPRYSVTALLTRLPRKTCSLRFRIEFALRLYHSNRAVAREYQKNIEAFAKISDNRVKFVAFSIRACYNSFRTWGYSSVGRALASHVRGQGFDSPYLHHARPSRTYLFRTKSFGWAFCCLIKGFHCTDRSPEILPFRLGQRSTALAEVNAKKYHRKQDFLSLHCRKHRLLGFSFAIFQTFTQYFFVPVDFRLLT